MDNQPCDIASWVRRLSEEEIPVLRHTVRCLAEAKEDIDRVSGREISAIVLHDPLMAVRVLAYILPYRGKRLRADITTVDHAAMMLGINPFFEHFKDLPSIEELLKPYPQALLGLLHVINRSQRASRYAYDWALWRHDLNVEEVTIAALLHDLAEILLWCFAPRQSLEIKAMQQANRALRSATAQEMVLGFRLSELQLALCTAWQLPELLLNLMDDQHAESPRVQNVKLAVDLARHSAHGWDDAALPDDYEAIAKLLNLNHEALMIRLGRSKPGEGENPPAGTETTTPA